MKILVLVSSPNSTLESVRTDGKKKMRAILGQDKELLFCEYVLEKRSTNRTISGRS